jgi:hypothetical protein
MNSEDNLIESYFGRNVLDKLPMNYKFCVIFHHQDKISDREMGLIKRYYSNEKYKSDNAVVLNFFKTI